MLLSILSHAGVGGLIELFVGIAEGEVEAKRYCAVVLLEGGILTAPLERLLFDTDPTDSCWTLFDHCRNHFLEPFQSEESDQFYDCSGKVLQLAFLWALACRSFKEMVVAFDATRRLRSTLNFNCRLVEAGQIMTREGQLDVEELRKLKGGVLYYEKCSQKGVDLWFKTGDQQLILIEVGETCNVTKGSHKTAAMKKTLADGKGTIAKEKRSQQLSLWGVVLFSDVQQVPPKFDCWTCARLPCALWHTPLQFSP